MGATKKTEKKTEKKEVTTAEFVERMSKSGGKRNGSKRSFSWKR